MGDDDAATLRSPTPSQPASGMASRCNTFEGLVDAKLLARRLRHKTDPFASMSGLDLTASAGSKESTSTLSAAQGFDGPLLFRRYHSREAKPGTAEPYGP